MSAVCAQVSAGRGSELGEVLEALLGDVHVRERGHLGALHRQVRPAAQVAEGVHQQGVGFQGVQRRTQGIRQTTGTKREPFCIRKLDPGDAVNVDPATLSDAERLALGARRLPDSLGAALDALEADTLLMDSLGDLRRRAYLAVKRSESAAFAAMDVATECFEHFTKI